LAGTQASPSPRRTRFPVRAHPVHLGRQRHPSGRAGPSAPQAAPSASPGRNAMTLRRLVYVVNVFPKLSETFIAHEVAELRRRGLEVQVLSLRRPAEEKRHAFVGEAGLDDIIHYADGP